jgi:hypothetical protein
MSPTYQKCKWLPIQMRYALFRGSSFFDFFFPQKVIKVIDNKTFSKTLTRRVRQHWKNETVESTHWRRKIDDFWQARSFDAKHCRFYRLQHGFYAFVLFCPKKSQMVRLGFEPKTLGSDFSINMVSVLAISATRLHIYVEVKY